MFEHINYYYGGIGLKFLWKEIFELFNKAKNLQARGDYQQALQINNTILQKMYDNNICY